MQKQRDLFPGFPEPFRYFRRWESFDFRQKDHFSILRGERIQFRKQRLERLFLRHQAAGSLRVRGIGALGITVCPQTHHFRLALLPVAKPDVIGNHMIRDPRKPTEEASRRTVLELMEILESGEEDFLQHFFNILGMLFIEAQLVMDEDRQAAAIHLKQPAKRVRIPSLASFD
jgi:hypothetical protein